MVNSIYTNLYSYYFHDQSMPYSLNEFSHINQARAIKMSSKDNKEK